MSARWDSAQLLQPITEDQPCGESLEDTELLASFDAFRLFGQSRPLDAPAEPDEKRIPKPAESPEWIEIRDKALEALAQEQGSAAAGLPGNRVAEDRRTAGIFRDAERGVAMAGDVLEPDLSARRRGRDAAAERAELLRRSDGDRRRPPPVPLVRSRQHGTFSLRDIDIATNQLAPAEGGRSGGREPDPGGVCVDAAGRARRSCSTASSAPSRR